MTHVGLQNLKFCIEIYQENNRKISINKKEDDNYYKKKDMSKIALLNNEIKDIHTNVKETVKNMITNVNDIHDLDDKSSKIKVSSYQFEKDSEILEKTINSRKLIRQLIIYCIFAFILIFILFLIFK